MKCAFLEGFGEGFRGTARGDRQTPEIDCPHEFRKGLIRTRKYSSQVDIDLVDAPAFVSLQHGTLRGAVRGEPVCGDTGCFGRPT